MPEPHNWLLQSSNVEQAAPLGHFVEHEPPQSTSVSLLSLRPLEQEAARLRNCRIAGGTPRTAAAAWRMLAKHRSVIIIINSALLVRPAPLLLLRPILLRDCVCTNARAIGAAYCVPVPYAVIVTRVLVLAVHNPRKLLSTCQVRSFAACCVTKLSSLYK